MLKHIIITAGDPLGIGPEVIVKALKKFKARAAITVIGDRQSLLAAGWRDNMGALVEVQSSFTRPAGGKAGPCAWGGDVSFKAFMAGVRLMNAGRARALVSAPISKEAWAMAGVKFTGHTEVLKKYASAHGGAALMMFAAGRIKCALATEHLAIKDLPRALTKQRIKTAAEIFAAQLGGRRAHIALAALNPHCGDGGKLGAEELKIISPAAAELKKAGYNISGPYPVDSLWRKHAAGCFDGILCMYHDAALTGLKLAAAAPAVHITAGLRWLRVSPVHGTAFDIAGRNKADESGMLAALNYAADAKNKA
ncbi:MAG: 4-hydroxythreonine-4-phosphate dehydrogenase PdxA [Elusimicrobiota bacterium]|nr:4-hydroxythreonine-4-phosphate dehydrogenase PdxA [Elusimicrobiota bacterium]